VTAIAPCLRVQQRSSLLGLGLFNGAEHDDPAVLGRAHVAFG
jgi:hypothetical protein